MIKNWFMRFLIFSIFTWSGCTPVLSKIIIHMNTPKPPLSNNPVVLIIEKLAQCYLEKTKEGQELDLKAANSMIFKEWLEKELAGDRTALVAAIKYIVAPLYLVEYEEGWNITNDITTHQFMKRQLKRCHFTKKEIELFMEHFPKNDEYPLNDFLKKYVVQQGLVVLDNYLESLE